jgi:hypothetical protein
MKDVIIGVTVGTSISPEKIKEIAGNADPSAEEQKIIAALLKYLEENPSHIAEKDPTVPDWAKEKTKPSYSKSEVGLGNVDNVKQYSASNPPPYPVVSVNGKTGKVQLGAADVGARPSSWMPTAQEVGALPDTYVPPDQTAAQVGADPAGTAAAAVSAHNTSTDSHGDLRLELKAINDRLNAFFDSDDKTLDELSEIVAYITSNKSLIDSITTSKVSVEDIINNLTTNVANKPLSAAQGVVLKGLIDAISSSLSNYQPKGDYALASAVPTKVSQLQNDIGYLTKHQDISGKLDAAKLPEAIDEALSEAKESGAFDGDDGVSPTVSVGAITGGTRITITDKNGAKTVDVMNGTSGNDGNGIKSAVLNADYTLTLTFDDGTKYTTPSIRGEKGDKGDSVKGDKGDPYTLTDTDKDTIVNAVIAANSLPDYWLTHLSAKIPSINTAMESAGRNKSAFYFYTDAHRISSAHMTPSILRYLYSYTSINKTNNGGDFFEPFATGADNLATMRNYMADMRGIPNHHSVIGNHDEDNESLTSDAQLYGFYLAWEENNDIVWGGYNFYYIDNKAENTRYLYLDIGKNFGKTGAVMVSNAQMQFVIDSLASLPEGWHAVPIAHIWYDYEISAIPDYVLNVLAVFDAYNGRTAGSVTHNGSAFDFDFADALGNVEFCIGGHVHADQVHYSNGGIPIIITDTDSTARKGSAATLGTITEGGIDAVVANYNTRKIKLIRLGRGTDRTIDIPAYQPVGPAEVVNILNVYDVQYNKRYSPTSQGYKDDNGVIAFLIPWADVWGKTIYFKGFSQLTSKNGQPSSWRGIKGTTNQGFSGTTGYDIFTTTNLHESNGVYSITVNSSTINSVADTFDYLQVQFVLNSNGTAISAADLANCIMTIDQPIE